MKRYQRQAHNDHVPQRLVLFVSALTVASLVITNKPAHAGFIQTVRGILTGDTGEGATGNTRGGAIRDEYCDAELADSDTPSAVAVPASSRQVVVLAPDTLETTTQAAPTLLLYLPFARTPAKSQATAPMPTQGDRALKFDIDEIDSVIDSEVTEAANLLFEFELRDADNANSLKKTYYALPQEAGLVKFQLPADTALEVGETYTWNFRLICRRTTPQSLVDEADQIQSDTEEQVVFGQIQRVAMSPQLEAALASSDPSGHYQAYLENGIWFDMVSTLAENPASPDWVTLLQEFDLGEVNPTPELLTPLPAETPTP